MIYCKKCGNKNDDDARYCSKCGNSLINVAMKDASFEKKVEDFTDRIERVSQEAGEKIEKAAEKIGEKTQDLGRRLEKATHRADRYFDNWWDRTFGIFGPLVSSFIILIVLRLIIEVLRFGAEDTVILGEISNLLLDYLLWIFILILISSYISYFSIRYKSFQWVSPIIIAVIFVVFSLIVVNIISVVGASIGDSELAKAELVWREKYIHMLFVIVLLVGYLVKVVSFAWEKEQKK